MIPDLDIFIVNRSLSVAGDKSNSLPKLAPSTLKDIFGRPRVFSLVGILKLHIRWARQPFCRRPSGGVASREMSRKNRETKNENI
jgi:hypothetical protein